MPTDQTLQPGESVKVTSSTPISVTGSGTNIVTATAGAAPTPTPDPTPTPTPVGGVLASKAEVLARPNSGAAWDRMLAAANSTISTTGMLSDQESPSNVRTLAAAFVAVRNNDTVRRAKVVTALKALKGQSLDRALALGREIGAYVIASDLIGATDVEVGYDQKAFYLGKLTQATGGGPSSLQACYRQRPNNWGTHAMGSAACILAKYGTAAQIDELYKVVKGWLGDYAGYHGFTYGDLSWQADSSKPVGINPKGATKSGHSIDGVLPDDQRRAGGFTWPPQKENYVWEALQGAMLASLVLERTGRPVASLSDQALYRAYRWLIDQCQFPPSGDDTWIPYALKKLYPSGSITKPSSTTPGKNLGWTDWLYG